MPLEFVACIGGCDETLREILNLRFSQGPPRAGPQASQPSGYLQASQSLNRMDSSQHPQPPDTRQARPLAALVRDLPPPTAAGESSSVICNCGQEAALLTVRKEGPNQGRPFYKCPGGSCSFFLWASSSRPEAGAPSSTSRHAGSPLACLPGPQNHPGGFGSAADDTGGGTSCLCSQAAVTRTVQKDGPNKGRQFHTCAKPRAQQCGFFQWADENVAPGEPALSAAALRGRCGGAWLGGVGQRRQGRRWGERVRLAPSFPVAAFSQVMNSAVSILSQRVAAVGLGTHPRLHAQLGPGTQNGCVRIGPGHCTRVDNVSDHSEMAPAHSSAQEKLHYTSASDPRPRGSLVIPSWFQPWPVWLSGQTVDSYIEGS